LFVRFRIDFQKWPNRDKTPSVLNGKGF